MKLPATDVPLPSEGRVPMGGPSLPNGIGASNQNKANTWGGSNWSGPPNAAALGKPPPGRDPKSRARSRDYLKQFVAEPAFIGLSVINWMLFLGACRRSHI